MNAHRAEKIGHYILRFPRPRPRGRRIFSTARISRSQSSGGAGLASGTKAAIRRSSSELRSSASSIGIPSSSSSKSSGIEETVAGSVSANFSGPAVDGGEVAGGLSVGEVAADAIGRPVAKTGKGGSGGCSKSGVQGAVGGSGPVETSGSGGEWEEETCLRLLRFRGILVGGGG